MTARPAPTMTAAAIAAAVGGVVAGDAERMVSGIAPLDRATERHVSFFAKGGYGALFELSNAGVVLVSPALAEAAGKCTSRVVVENPHEAMLALLPIFYPEPDFVPGVHPAAVVDSSARVAAGARVDAFCVIGAGVSVADGAWIGAGSVVGDGVTVGARTRLYPQVTLYAGSVIGERVVLHSGTRIGSDGFGYVFQDGAHQKISHVGRCVIGDDVEIGANCAVDRGSIDDTVIGAGSKLDNLVHIGHNVRIGRLCLFMAQVGIAGSTHIGDGVIFAGQSGATGHLEIGSGARMAARTAVFRDVPAGETWSGTPARPHREELRKDAALHRLAARLKEIEALLDAAKKVP
jgi:UDP-3-O-[3-hydroxymyristoyl] glucosamine N-acyltransferase